MSRLPAFGLSLLGLAGLVLAWLAHDAPLEPQLARGWLRGDALSALTMLALAAHGLVGPLRWSSLFAAGLFGLASLSGHLGLTAALILLGGLSLAQTAHGWPMRLLPLLACLLTAAGLILLGSLAGEWRYAAPAAGLGRNSLSLALLLLAVLLAGGSLDLVRSQPLGPLPLVATIGLYALLRLFSLGPWNLGWLLATLLLGGALALAAAWQGAAAPPAATVNWLGIYLVGMALASVGLGSSAGVAAAGYALLVWPILRLGLAAAGTPRWAAWPMSTALPFSGPFLVGWMGIAAALAGGVSLLAVALWGATLLAALPTARLATSPDVASANPNPARNRSAAVLSMAFGLGAPLILADLLGPIAAQLQGGLSPYGELAFWPWAGIIAFDAGRQTVATMPSFALAGLMLILAALIWLILRLRHLRPWERK